MRKIKKTIGAAVEDARHELQSWHDAIAEAIDQLGNINVPQFLIEQEIQIRRADGIDFIVNALKECVNSAQSVLEDESQSKDIQKPIKAFAEHIENVITGLENV